MGGVGRCVGVFGGSRPNTGSLKETGLREGSNMKGQDMTRTQGEAIIWLLAISLFCFLSVSAYAIYHVEAFKKAVDDSARRLHEARMKFEQEMSDMRP